MAPHRSSRAGKGRQVGTRRPPRNAWHAVNYFTPVAPRPLLPLATFPQRHSRSPTPARSVPTWAWQCLPATHPPLSPPLSPAACIHAAAASPPSPHPPTNQPQAPPCDGRLHHPPPVIPPPRPALRPNRSTNPHHTTSSARRHPPTSLSRHPASRVSPATLAWPLHGSPLESVRPPYRYAPACASVYRGATCPHTPLSGPTKRAPPSCITRWHHSLASLVASLVGLTRWHPLYTLGHMQHTAQSPQCAVLKSRPRRRGQFAPRRAAIGQPPALRRRHRTRAPSPFPADPSPFPSPLPFPRPSLSGA